MGFFKKIGKAFKSVAKFAGGMLGLDTGADKKLYEQQERQLKQAQEARKLESSNEVQNVVQFDNWADSGGGPVGMNVRRKKKSAGALSSGLGLQV